MISDSDHIPTRPPPLPTTAIPFEFIIFLFLFFRFWTHALENNLVLIVQILNEEATTPAPGATRILSLPSNPIAPHGRQGGLGLS